MLVSEYVLNNINNRPLKYGTKQSYLKGIKSLGIWEMDISDLNSALIFEKTDQMRSHNVKKNIYIMLRSVFRELGIFSDLPILSGISKSYSLPSQDELHSIIDRSKYRRVLYLCMYAGLRVGEACAVVPSQLEGNYLTVDRAFSQDGKHLGSPKTYGKVLIPSWLADEVRTMTKEDEWQLGMSTQLVSWACVSLSKKGSQIHINPHMLRHWFATDMIRRGVNPETVRRQMRHSNINTTMRIYVQVNSYDLEQSVPLTPKERAVASENVVPFRLKVVN
jgi:predicted DNA-binding transcriptional regulator